MSGMLTERYRDRLAGVLSCYDRIVITGTLPGICYAAGMTSFLNSKKIRIFDYARFAEPLRDAIRERAQQVAEAQGARIEYIAKAHIRKEDVVAKVLAARGDHPGLVHIISAMENCNAYKPWHDKATGKTKEVTKLRRYTREEKHELSDKYMRMVDLQDFADAYPKELSGGMKQRVAIARGYAVASEVLLMDEPFGALDALTRAKLQDELMKICEKTKATVVMVTHDVDEAVLLSDKIVMMTNGPAATIGEVLHVDLPRPRERLTMAHDPAYINYRAAVIEFLYEKQVHVEKEAA